MGFVVPEFPIVCNTFRGDTFATKVAKLVNQPCNLGMGKRTLLTQFGIETTVVYGGPIGQLLLPPFTDIRSFMVTNTLEWVEVPASSGRWYLVAGVDDFGKGFPNEHRFAVISPISYYLDPSPPYVGCYWPQPIP